MNFDNFNRQELQNDVMRVLVSKTLKKFGAEKTSLSSKDKQKLRDLVSRLKEQTDIFLENANRTQSVNAPVNEEVEKPVRKESPIQFRRRNLKK